MVSSGVTPLAHGIDLTEVARIERLIGEHGERFLSRCFTHEERRYCEGSGKRRAEHYAARFAAKEAVLKALGCGLRDGIAWTDIEVTREASGRPGVTLTGRAGEVAAASGMNCWTISLSHTAGHAIASVIGVGAGIEG